MRLHRLAALVLAGALLLLPMPAPASAHGEGGQAPATAENFAKLRDCESGGN